MNKTFLPASGANTKINANVAKKMIAVCAIGLSLFQVYFSTFGMIDTVRFRAIHLILAMVLIFCVYPLRRGGPKNHINILDIIFMILAICVGVYLAQEWHDIVMRRGEITDYDIYFGVVCTFLTLEIARRTTGWALPIVALLFLLYTYLGNILPGSLSHSGIDFERIIGQLYITTEGIYGLPLGVMVNYVFLFILFASMLHRFGAGEYFINLSYAVAGRYRGGPAKTALVASGMMAMITGSSTANVVSTGAFTIPLMKKVGYKAETAGGIEVAASVGGQLTPPIMGAGAFIMAEWTGTPYIEIIKMAAIPAIIYYLSVGFYVHILAAKRGLKTLQKDEIPSIWDTFKEGCYLLLPLIVLMGMLIYGYTPMTSVVYAMASLVVVAGVVSVKQNDKTLKDFFDELFGALQSGATNAVLVTASLACAGILMCCLGLTGVGLKFSSIVMKFSGGNLLLALFLVAIASLFLGMELPVTAAYITCAVLAVPALKIMGVPMIAAHMIVFWLSMDSAITPPVCISAYAACGISGGHPLKTGFAAWKLAKALYILPILFAYTNILTGTLLEAIIIAIPACFGLFALTVTWEGYLFKPTTKLERLLLAIAIFFCLYPHTVSYLIGIAIVLLVAAKQKFAYMANRVIAD